MSFLLFDDFATRIMQWNVLTGIFLAVFGLALAFLAKKLTRVIRKSTEVAPNDHLYLIFKATGLIMVVVALIFMIVK